MALTDCGDAIRRLRAVQLQEIRTKLVDDAAQLKLRRVDGHRDDASLAAGSGGQHCGMIELDVAGASLEEHEADVIGPRLKRGIDAFRVGKPADLDLCRHPACLA